LLDNYYQKGTELIDAENFGLEIHARSVFLQGLFFMKTNEIPNKLKPLQKYLNQMSQICSKYRLNIQLMALGYAISQNFISRIIIGAETKEQLTNNLNATKLASEVIQEINEIKVEENELLNPANWK
jgi:aryl-alcohol dehydrogenase-like predicted oxidoreductase